MANYCPNCGTALQGAKFCPNCGAKIDENAARAQTTGDAFMNQKASPTGGQIFGTILGIGLLSSLFRPHHCFHPMFGPHFHGGFHGPHFH